MSQKQKQRFAKNASSVFVANLNRKIDKRALHQIFSAFGTIRRCEVVRGHGGAPKGYGFVHYEHEASAAACITALNGSLLIDKRITVEYVSPLEERKQAEIMCQVYVKNLPPNFTADQLKQMFEVFGRIAKHQVTVEPNGKSAYGYIIFTTAASAECAVQMLNGTRVGTAELKVEHAVKIEQPKMEPEKRVAQLGTAERGVNLYVNNLDSSIDSNRLRQLFAPFGTIKSVKVMLKPGRPQGYGFVRLNSTEEAIKAMAAMNGEKVENKALQVSVARCKSDKDANSQLRQNIANIVAQNTYGQSLQPADGGRYILLTVPANLANIPTGMCVSNDWLKAVFGTAGGQNQGCTGTKK